MWLHYGATWFRCVVTACMADAWQWHHAIYAAQVIGHCDLLTGPHRDFQNRSPLISDIQTPTDTTNTAAIFIPLSLLHHQILT